jgi:hypothetical protein
LTSTNAIEHVEGVILVTLIVSGVLFLLHRRFRRLRPDFHVGKPLGVAFGLRLVAIAGISATGLSRSLRGGDEITFMHLARFLAAQPLGHGDFPHGLFQLQTVIFALELKLGFLTEGAMRIVQVGIALTGVLLILVVVYDFAGNRAVRLAAWLIALEPASIFFNSALHKDPNMELAAGLVVFGGSWIWRRLDLRGLFICALGGFIGIETRSYAGWFLVAAVVLLLLHAALRNIDRPLRAMPVIYGVVVIAFVTTPVLLQLSSSSRLKTLQGSQNANTQRTNPGQDGPNGNNLALEQVNFSSRGAIITNLPKRIRDLILEPYPWQLGDTSQRFGAIGTLFAYAILLLLIRYAWRNRGQVFSRAGPLLYPLFFLLIAYSLSLGNAGTGFRYRAHLVTLSVASMAILREHARRKRGLDLEPAPVPGQPDLKPRVAIRV